MAKLTKSLEVEQVVRKYLEDKGCSISSYKRKGETGPDIKATRGKYTWFVEAIGFEEHPWIRSREFYEAFFRVISRDTNSSNETLVLALPRRFKDGMRQRTRNYPVAWAKLGRTFSNLRIWYVDTEEGTVEEYQWATPFD